MRDVRGISESVECFQNHKKKKTFLLSAKIV